MNDPVKVSPKDVFLHLLAIVTLYASAVAFCTLVFQYINYWFPDVIRDAYYYQEGLTSAMRYALSVLIVVFPVYFFTSRMLRRMYEVEPERMNLSIRKWLSHFTIFLAAGIAIGWLIGVINTFLNGDFTAAFLLKALTIFFVTGSIFYYYRAVTRGEENKSSVRYYGYAVAVIVFAAVISAFFLVGSPQNRRLQKEDNQRTMDLQNIQYQIGSYYQAKSKLPAALSDLNDAFRGVNVPKDPKGKDYEYSIKGPKSFELCAEFATTWNSNANANYPYPTGAVKYGDTSFGPYTNNWEHQVGRECFQRTIDTDYFKPLPQ